VPQYLLTKPVRVIRLVFNDFIHLQSSLCYVILQLWNFLLNRYFPSPGIISETPMRSKLAASLCNLGISLLFIWLTVTPNGFRESLEYRGYDAMSSFLPVPETTSPLVLVDINDQALETFGPWPWPRTRIAKGIEKAAAGGARTIGLPLLMDLAQDSLATETMAGLAEAFRTTFGSVDDPKLTAFYQTLLDFQEQLAQDQRLANAITAAGTVVMPVRFGTSPGKSVPPAASIDAFIERSCQVNGTLTGIDFPRSNQVVLPLPVYLQGVHRLGHLNFFPDSDGTLRRSSPVYGFRGKPMASFTLTLAADFLGIPEKELFLQPPNILSFDGHRIPLTAEGCFFIRFNGGVPPFERYGFAELISDALPANALQGKLVIFNLSATGLAPRMATPLNSRMPIGELTAHTLRTLLDGTPICPLPNQRWVSLALIALAGLFITFVWPRLSMLSLTLSSLLGIGLFAGAGIFFFKVKGLWFPSAMPALELLAGFILTAIMVSPPKTPSPVCDEAAAQEVKRLQGMSFQSQGLLDAAWEKLYHVPVDEDVKVILYDLAIDFEKQGEPQKALRVYEHIEAADADYKDIQTRMTSLTVFSQTVAMKEESEDRLPAEEATASGTAPQYLGRYELLHPIGQGAMGTVFLGQDPHIKRETAIKTYRFNEEYDPADAEEMKRKFFREAESAGKLSHPGIVTIYDAGEQGGLAYIAMEFLDGKDLRAYVAKGALLPMRKVIDYAADIADALAYAHRQGVVHRDIKPANIMLLKSGVVKITDFGIARIMASSKTRTGVVKGTPYYMAPEQITGKKVDGRCDVFSLGIVLFQLLTGSLPFTAASPGELMHKIVSDPHPDPKSINPKILTPLVMVLNKALEKDVTKRYQDAGQVASHLRLIGQKIDVLLAQRSVSVRADGS
jgi:eukaryotic-like serine/threonine-protein kinase